MPTNLSVWERTADNLLLMIFWNILIFFMSIKIDTSFFDSSKNLYVKKSWERDGKFYTKKLKIKKWKDILPQHVGKNGFSKKHLDKDEGLSEEYIKQFIMETCRAEWNHTMCALFSFISILINPIFYGMVFAIVPIIINAPFIAIQRYNRIRLDKLLARKKKIVCRESYNTVKV